MSIRTTRIRNQIAALWKWLLSFRTHDWKLQDYPIAIREQEPNPDYCAPRFKQHRYLAYIVNWAVTGGGETPQEAWNDLRKKFDSIKDKWKLQGRPLIRPGAIAPMEFATQEQVSLNQELSEDFIRRVLDLDWAWISDESSLWDFHTDQTNERFLAKITEIYGVDVSDIESAKLWEILRKIESERTSSRSEPLSQPDK